MLFHKRTVENSSAANPGNGGDTMRIFQAIINQAGTADPVLTIVNNTLGAAVSSCTRSSAGNYVLDFAANVLNANETISLTNGIAIGSGVLYAETTSSSQVRFSSTNGFASFEDDIISNASLMILIP